MHQIGHHDAVRGDAHTARSDVGMQHIGTVGSGQLALQELFQTAQLQHQRIGILQDGGHGGIGWQLVVEEHAPVVAVGHGQFAVGQSQLDKHFVPHFLPVVDQFLGLQELPWTGEHAFGQFLETGILIGGMEIVVVLEGKIGKQVRTFV